jgi:hypothetical protein
MSAPIYPFLHPKRHTDPLQDIDGVMAEVRRIYKALRAGEITAEHGWVVGTLLSVLKFQASLLDKSDLQKRVAELEERLSGVAETRGSAGMRHLNYAVRQ